MLLTDEEISDLWVTELDDRRTVTTFARAIEAAILAKLASAELPEPVYRAVQATSDGSFMGGGKPNWDKREFNEPWIAAGRAVVKNLYTADQMRQAYAQGAAAQLAEKPSAWKWKVNRFHQHLEGYCPPDDAYDEGTLIELYTRRQA